MLIIHCVWMCFAFLSFFKLRNGYATTARISDSTRVDLGYRCVCYGYKLLSTLYSDFLTSSVFWNSISAEQSKSSSNLKVYLGYEETHIYSCLRRGHFRQGLNLFMKNEEYSMLKNDPRSLLYGDHYSSLHWKKRLWYHATTLMTLSLRI